MYCTVPNAREEEISDSHQYRPGIRISHAGGDSMMDTDEDLPEWTSKGKCGQLVHSLSNLTNFARAPPLAATVINVVCAAIGIGVWHFSTGVVAFAGAVFAILSALGILKWVMGL